MKRIWGAALLVPALLAAATSLTAQAAGVTGLRVVPAAGGGSELVVEIAGSPAFHSHFAMSSPTPRMVLDIGGARHSLPTGSFAAIRRGGVLGVRTSQYRPGVVRVVVDLERGVPYSVVQAADGLRVRFSGEPVAFEPWSSGDAPVRVAAAEPTAPPPASPTPQRPVARPAAQRRQEPVAQCITVSFSETAIHDVLASFAEFTGRSIVPGSGVQGTVTASIRCQPWDVALQSILDAHGLAARELPSGIIQVDAIENLQKRQTQEALETQTFRINYVPVDEIRASLEPLKSERGRVSANASTNTLIVTDVASVLRDMRRMVQTLDIRTPQVSIEAKIIFVNRTRADELGFTYDIKDSRGSSLNQITSSPDPRNPTELTNQDVVALGGNSIAALGNANARVNDPQLRTVMSLVLGRYTLIGFLDALQSLELSDVQASPVITTLDNQRASIRVGERTPIRVVDLATPGGAAGGAGGSFGAPRATAELVETGIILEVTPHITSDRQILMQIRAERSNAQPAPGDIGVTFQNQIGETRLMVADGETAVIGGLTVTETVSVTTGIPFLMELPLVGRLFRNEAKREQKRDLLIMVTPHIVDTRSTANPE